MIERTENVKTRDGIMEVFIARPDGPGPFPVIVQIMDALGMREELRDHVRRIASWGYYVVTPDLFYRAGLKGPLDPANPESMKLIMAVMKDLTNERAISDVEDTLALAGRDAAARKGKLGIYGYCMGGRLALTLCQTLGDRVAAGGSIHPGGLVTDTPDSPHLHIDKVKAEMYFGIADKDNFATPPQMATLEQALKAQGIAYQLEWHPGAPHGYMMQSRPDAYNKDAAETVWSRLQALFARTLR